MRVQYAITKERAPILLRFVNRRKESARTLKNSVSVPSSTYQNLNVVYVWPLLRPTFHLGAQYVRRREEREST